ncbi:GntR family transcriptional regulator [Janibacter melonis]|uniref:GntR family transcriptional regulator n=1 Tax=Janibacter melonis TaxID=262209 RepID=UPI0020440499|nr:GntR family transcriptional regulator [Janibacter melonis]MCM3556016.1 GntR family transcriptional regulator [Janibacter melonis]
MAATELDVALDRDSPVPLYHQIAEQLSAAIHDGRLESGDAFENEIALATRLSVSRPTIRRAIQEMVDRGLLVRRRGLGTHVANRKVHREAVLSSLWDDLDAAGRSPRTEVLDLERAVDPRAASMLDLPPETELLSLTRVRYAGDDPLALLHNWLPPTSGEIGRDELERAGLYAALRGRGVRPSVARQSIGARMPTAAERKALHMRAGQPVLTMTRVAFDAGGTAIELGEHAYRAEDYTIDLMVDER